MITFENGIDIRSRQPSAPTVARIRVKCNVNLYCVIGTQYVYLHTMSGDVRTWSSYSGARRVARAYAPF